MKTLRAWLRRMMWIAAGLSASAFATVTFIVLQAPRPPRFPPQKTPADAGIPCSGIAVTTVDNVRLAGWWCPAVTSRGTVVLCHGYPGSRSETLPLIPFLHRAGYSVLAFDFRRLGASGGKMSTVGLQETRDLRAAVDEARRRSSAPVYVIGLSMGAAVALMEASDDDRVQAVVADSSYDDLDQQTRRRIGQFLPWPLRGPLGAWAVWLGTNAAGEPLANASPLRAVGRMAPRPVLFIHCAGDRVVPVSASRRLHEAAGSPKSLWVLPDGGHILAYQRQTAEYERRVLDLLRDASAAQPAFPHEPLRPEEPGARPL